MAASRQTRALAYAALAVGAQAVASSEAQMEAFLASQAWPTPFRAVVKPVDGAASHVSQVTGPASRAVMPASLTFESLQRLSSWETYAHVFQESPL